MILRRTAAVALMAALLGPAAGGAAELPLQRGQPHKPKRAERARTCDIAGNPGVLAGNGICVRLSGYVSSEFTTGQLK